MPPDLRVCAVAVAYQNPDEFGCLIDSLRESTRPVEGVIVIDNSVIPSQIEENRAIFERLACDVALSEFIPMPQNIGSAGGFRHGMVLAHQLGFDWVWLLDQDGTVDAKCLEQMMLYVERSDAICPVVLSNDDRERELPFGLVTNIWGAVRIPRKPSGAKDIPISIFGTHGVMISKRAMEQVGYYDAENFFCGWEDFDYARRLRVASLNILKVYAAIAYHPDLVARYRAAEHPWRPWQHRLFLKVNQYVPLPVFLGFYDDTLTGLRKIRQDTRVAFVQKNKNLKGWRFAGAFLFSSFCLVILKLSGKRIGIRNTLKKYMEMRQKID